MSQYKVLFQLSGSIACYKACQVISDLRKWSCDVRVVATPSALEFVGSATLEGLSGNRVLTNTFSEGHMMAHIDYERWADVIVLCPATANTINRLAQGLADDLIGNIFLAHDFEKPYLIFPAMNTKMFEHPTVQESVSELKALGIQVETTESGSLACGETGEGRLQEPTTILKSILRALPQSHSKSVLITSGGTQEPIDSVRFIGNGSTGKTGAFLAEAFAKAGWDVTLLKAKNSQGANGFIHKQFEFSSYQDLNDLLVSQLQNHNYDAIIHAAAVSDYSVASIQQGKQLIEKRQGKLTGDQSLTIKLQLNEKLLNKLKSFCKNAPEIVGFKLTSSSNWNERVHAVQKLFNAGNVDLVVQNDLSEISNEQHLCRLFRHSNVIAETKTKFDLAEILIKTLSAADKSASRSIGEVFHDLMS